MKASFFSPRSDAFLLPAAALVLLPGIYAAAQWLIRVDKACFDFHVGVREGWLVERLTFVLLALGAVVALGLGWRRRRDTLTGLFFLGMAAALFVGAGEEVSWGQRALDIETPEWLSEINSQDEINLHNTLELLTDFSTNKALELGAFAFGVVGPLAARRGRVPLPALVLVPGFLLGGLLMQGNNAGFEKEVGELVISLGLFLYLAMVWRVTPPFQVTLPRLLLFAGSGAVFAAAVVALALAICP